MGNPYQSPESAINSDRPASRTMLVATSDWLLAFIVLAVAVAAGVFGFSGSIGELPWQQSPANTWQSVIWGVFVGAPSTLACYWIAKMVSSGRPMFYATWSITASVFPFTFSWVVMGVLAGC